MCRLLYRSCDLSASQQTPPFTGHSGAERGPGLFLWEEDSQMASPDVLSSRETKTTMQWVNPLKRWSENDDFPAFGGEQGS